MPVAHYEKPPWVKGAEPFFDGGGLGLGLVWPALERYLRLGYLGLLWAPWSVWSPLGSGPGFLGAGTWQRCVGRVDHGYLGLSLGHLLPTAMAQGLGAGSAVVSVPPSLAPGDL